MKKFALAAVAAAAMTGGVAQAYTVGTYQNGFVVPDVELTANGTTAIGVINRSNSTVPVFWVFHDQNSGHVVDGCFPMTANEFKPVIWGSAPLADASMAGMKGYLVFAAGASTGASAAQACLSGDVISTTAKLSANAFQVSQANGGDVAVVPVIDGPLNLASPHNLKTLNEHSLISIGGAAQVVPGTGPVVTARYAKGASGMSTKIAVWSTGDHSGRHTVDIYDNKQQRMSTNFTLTKSELDHFDPSTMLGTSAFNDGFIEWNAGMLPAAAGTASVAAGTPEVPLASASRGATERGSVFVYSVISMPSFGAVQTLLGATQ